MVEYIIINIGKKVKEKAEDRSNLNNNFYNWKIIMSKPIYAKILHSSLCHYGFIYKIGLNIDTIPFNPKGECQSGGLYFCKYSDIYLYLDNGTLIADVEIPEDAIVYHEKNKKSKANKLIIKNIRPIPHELYLKAINNGILIRPNSM